MTKKKSNDVPVDQAVDTHVIPAEETPVTETPQESNEELDAAKARIAELEALNAEQAAKITELQDEVIELEEAHDTIDELQATIEKLKKKSAPKEDGLPPMPEIDPEKELDFVTPAFSHNGKAYKSAAVKAAAEAGDHDARMLVLELIRFGQVIQVEPKKEGK